MFMIYLQIKEIMDIIKWYIKYKDNNIILDILSYYNIEQCRNLIKKMLKIQNHHYIIIKVLSQNSITKRDNLDNKIILKKGILPTNYNTFLLDDFYIENNEIHVMIDTYSITEENKYNYDFHYLHLWKFKTPTL